MKPRAQRSLGGALPVERDDVGAGARVGQARDALREALVHREVEGAPGLLGRALGRLHERLRVVHEHARGLAGGVADDLPARGGLRLARDAEERHRPRVDEHGVAVGPLEDDRVVGREGAQRRVGRKAADRPRRRRVPLALVPASTAHPLARPARLDGCRHPREDLRVAARCPRGPRRAARSRSRAGGRGRPRSPGRPCGPRGRGHASSGPRGPGPRRPSRPRRSGCRARPPPRPGDASGRRCGRRRPSRRGRQASDARALRPVPRSAAGRARQRATRRVIGNLLGARAQYILAAGGVAGRRP